MSHGMEARASQERGLGRAEMGAREGKVPPLGLEKAQWLNRDAWKSGEI